MMLDQEHARKAELLGRDDVPDEFVIAVAVAGRAAARPGAAEESEFHRSAPLYLMAGMYGRGCFGSSAPAPMSFRGAARRRTRNPYSRGLSMGSGLALRAIPE